MQFVSDRRHRFEAGVDEVWDAIAAVDSYRRWWPWLQEFDAKDLAAGEEWHCVVKPSLPYVVRFLVTVDEVVRPHSVAATLTGDLRGTARLEISARGAGSETRLTSALEPASATLRAMAIVARPLVRRGHDWVLDTGAVQFARHAMEERRS